MKGSPENTKFQPVCFGKIPYCPPFLSLHIGIETCQVPGVREDEGRKEDGEKKQGDLPESNAQHCDFFLGSDLVMLMIVDLMIFSKVIVV